MTAGRQGARRGTAAREGKGDRAARMKLALLADVHANLEALEACLAHAEEQGAERYAFLGDLVGYGADPARGRWSWSPARRARRAGGAGEPRRRRAWTGTAHHERRGAPRRSTGRASRLAEAQRALLAGLPLVARDGRPLLVHGSPEAPGAVHLRDRPAARGARARRGPAPLGLRGHVHEPVLYYTGAATGRCRSARCPGVAHPVPPHRAGSPSSGSAGQPRDGNPAACYALADLAAGRAHLPPRPVRLPGRRREGAPRPGLPEALARRLERGR